MSGKIGLKLKLKSNLKKQIEDESSKGGNDSRFLNFYDLKDNEKMRILFVPDETGELWAKFRKHGPNLKVRGTGAIRCAYESSGDTCPACAKGFELLDLSKETEDKAYKDEAKRWFARDYTLMSCIVLESPFEVAESPDHNQVKLMYVPFAIEKLIKEAITEGQIDEDELCRTPFWIKKTKNGGGFADYSSSYFARKAVEDEELAFFDDQKVEQFNYETLDLIPAATTEQEVQEWLDKAIDVVERGDSKEDKEKDEAPRRETRREPEKRTAPKPTPSDEIDEDTDRMGENRTVAGGVDSEAGQEEPEKPARSSSLRDRLANLK